MNIYAPLSDATGGYADLCRQIKAQFERLLYSPPELSLLLATPQENTNALAQFTMWETTQLLPLQVGILNTRRLIIVPNKEDKANFIASGVTSPIEVCPLYCVGQFAPFPAIRPLRFLHVGSEYGIPDRKRHQDIINAFCAAFPTQSDVELIIKRSKKCGPLVCFDKRVTIIDEVLTTQQIHALYSNCHVGIFPGGLESWGLPIAELAATGRASITPLYRGPAEFLTESSAFALPYGMGRAPERAYRGVGKVAIAPMSGIIAAMQFVYSNSFEVYRRGLIAARSATELTPAHFGARLREILHNYACKSGKYVVACGAPSELPDAERALAFARNHEQQSDAGNSGVRDQPDAVGR